MSTAVPASSGAFYGWRVLAVCTFCQFVAIGCTMYLLGLFIEPLSLAWSATPGQIGSASAMFAVGGALLGPLLGHLADKGWTKRIMLAGSVVISLGFIALSLAQSLWQAALICVFLLAPGTAMLGAIPTTVMVAQWFSKRRGLAIGITAAGISIGGFIMPMIAAQLLAHLEWSAALRIIGCGIALLLIPGIALFAVNRPADVNQYPDGIATAEEQSPNDAASGTISTGTLLTDRNFWLVALCIGFLSFLGLLCVTYIAPYARESGLSLQNAALMISLYSICGISGKFALGWLCDHLQPRRMLSVTMALAAIGWFPLLLSNSVPAFLIAAAMVGFAMGGMIPAWAALIAQLFGLENFGRVRGIMSLALVAFTFLPGPLGGYLRDSTGTYATAFTWLWFMLPAGVVLSLFVGQAATVSAPRAATGKAPG
ncbi:MFS transporter [Pseudomaricurvus sp. HS19]|uniref:MFS transporter n=1 Tax=Pseudomaricurvus sp. HS19 TaxID=2692626 RepID=UPI00136B993E|nr:MFS transporter [Pseudomaricurvus sp. HS19]MYM63367.1 MFS transporter [Pseudomaricurvus sp. HS19]